MIEVLALQANKNEPDNPSNKIAFTLDGKLCFVTDPRAAHDIITRAEADLVQRAHDDYLYLKARGYPVTIPFTGSSDALSFSTARILAGRTDLAKIAKRA